MQGPVLNLPLWTQIEPQYISHVDTDKTPVDIFKKCLLTCYMMSMMSFARCKMATVIDRWSEVAELLATSLLNCKMTKVKLERECLTCNAQLLFYYSTKYYIIFAPSWCFIICGYSSDAPGAAKNNEKDHWMEFLPGQTVVLMLHFLDSWVGHKDIN